MDESYIHNHYTDHGDSLFDPNDELAIEPRDKFKGQRWCFIAAMIGDDPQLHSQAEPQKKDHAHLLMPSIDIFQGGKQKKDYLAMFDAEYFEAWMKKLCSEILTDYGPCMIIMDNTAYHKCYPRDTPKPHLTKKADLATYLQQQGEVVNGDETRAELETRVRNWIKEHVPFEVQRIAAQYGHKVVFTPPYHSDLQPIELLWAHVKRAVGRQYDDQTNLKLVQERLENKFKKLDRNPEPIGKFFRHVHEIEQRLITEEILIEVAIEEEIEAEIAAHAEGEEDIRVHAEDVEDESDEGSLSETELDNN